MKILLLALNAKYIHSSLALRCVRANLPGGLRDNCEILEMTVNNRSDEILSQVYRRKPDVLGLSCYIWNIGAMLETARELKKVLPAVKIIAGGPEAAHSAAEILAGHGVDMVVPGEGETAFAALAANGFSPRGDGGSALGGVVFLENGRVIKGAEHTPADMDALRFAYDGAESLASSGLENRIIYYEASRGCPFACAYCLSSVSGGVRRVSLETAYRQLGALLALKPAQVKLVDRTFNCDRRYAESIWRFLMENDNEATNFHFEISGGLLDESALALLAGARPGLFQFEIGVQTANAAALAAISRPDDLGRLFENVRHIVKRRNIHVHLDLIAGLPFEGFDSFRNSFNAVYSLAPHMLQLGFLKLLKGSPLRKDAEKYKIAYRTAAPYEVLSTAWLGFDDILRLKKTEAALEIYYNSGQYRGTVRFLEKFFDTPFDFYDTIAYEHRLGEGINRPKASVARGLYDFGARLCGEEQKLRDLLRFDLCLNEHPRALPGWLREDVPGEAKKRLGAPKRGDMALERFSYSADIWVGGGELAAGEVYILFDYSRGKNISGGINCVFTRIQQRRREQ